MMTELFSDTTFWVLISFVLFCGLAYRYGWKAAMGKLDGRIEEIRKEVDAAESLRVEAQELLAQYQRKHNESEAEAKRILERARLQAEAMRIEAERALEENVQRWEEMMKERLGNMETQAKTELQEHAATLTVRAAEEIIKANMGDKEQKVQLDASLKRVGAYL